ELVLSGELLQPLDGLIVGDISLIVSARLWPDLDERVDPDQPPVGVQLAPCFDVLEPTLVELPPFGVHFQALGPRTLAEDFFHPFSHPPLPISRGEREAAPSPGLPPPKHEAAPANRHTNVEREPRLADLRLAGEDGDALWDQLGQDDAHRLELLRLQLARG